MSEERVSQLKGRRLVEYQKAVKRGAWKLWLRRLRRVSEESVEAREEGRDPLWDSQPRGDKD